mmetsp:Transcript_47315/g.137801  ORF Transcript_47315/g.137801 Transcript_47315/m.137801 type:complete len:85 (-) Transcript_47315:203-457(-)
MLSLGGVCLAEFLSVFQKYMSASHVGSASGKLTGPQVEECLGTTKTRGGSIFHVAKVVSMTVSYKRDVREVTLVYETEDAKRGF